MLLKYNVLSPLLLANPPNLISKLNLRVFKILNKKHIYFNKEFQIKTDNSYFQYDIKIKNVLIEINGDFWHANPQKYSATDILHFPGKNIMAKNIWEKDIKKYNHAKKLGFNIFYLWESQINKMNDDEIFEIIKNKLKMYNINI